MCIFNGPSQSSLSNSEVAEVQPLKNGEVEWNKVKEGSRYVSMRSGPVERNCWFAVLLLRAVCGTVGSDDTMTIRYDDDHDEDWRWSRCSRTLVLLKVMGSVFILIAKRIAHNFAVDGAV